MRKLLIINDACPDNTTAGSYIKAKTLVGILAFSGALDRLCPTALYAPVSLNGRFVASDGISTPVFVQGVILAHPLHKKSRQSSPIPPHCL